MCFFYQFPTIFCTFVQILRVFLCTLAQFCALPASSFSVLLYKLFLHIARNCTCEAHSFFGIFAQTFSSLPPHFFQLVRNFVAIWFPASLQDFTASLSYCSFFLRQCLCFYNVSHLYYLCFYNVSRLCCLCFYNVSHSQHLSLHNQMFIGVE